MATEAYHFPNSNNQGTSIRVDNPISKGAISLLCSPIPSFAYFCFTLKLILCLSYILEHWFLH